MPEDEQQKVLKYALQLVNEEFTSASIIAAASVEQIRCAAKVPMGVALLLKDAFPSRVEPPGTPRASKEGVVVTQVLLLCIAVGGGQFMGVAGGIVSMHPPMLTLARCRCLACDINVWAVAGQGE